VPLIGVNLKAATAGMTTMLDYGMMEAWNKEIRRYALENSEEEAPLDENEEIIFKHSLRTIIVIHLFLASGDPDTFTSQTKGSSCFGKNRLRSCLK